jgi:hypothetical protein
MLFKANLRLGLSSVDYHVRPKHSSSSGASLPIVFPKQWRHECRESVSNKQERRMVVSGKAVNLSSSMLSDAYHQIVCHADVQRAACLIAHHVNPVIVIG